MAAYQVDEPYFMGHRNTRKRRTVPIEQGGKSAFKCVSDGECIIYDRGRPVAFAPDASVGVCCLSEFLSEGK